MNTETRKDMTLGGIFIVDGGTYGLVSLKGVCRINGDLDAVSFSTLGTWSVNGSLKCGEAHVHGTGTILKDAALASLDSDGVLIIKGALSTKGEILAKGSLSVTGPIRATSITMEGTLTGSADIEADKVELHGALHTTGMLNADHIHLLFAGNNAAREIGGSIVHIEPQAWSSQGLFRASSSFRCDNIEADEIHISGVTAKVVRGAKVQIGPGCHIALVEYGEEFQIDPSSHVDQAQEIDR